jgi:hypothetical protein
MEGSHRFLANHTAISVIEEKGEGFENGKNRFLAACGLAFNLEPPRCVVRLKIPFSYKNITE